MKLTKTALRELSAKYRAVLMKCALMNMMIFAGALMPHTANAGIMTVDKNTQLNQNTSVTDLNIEFASNGCDAKNCTLDGQKHTLSSSDGKNSLTITTTSETGYGGQLNDITLKASEIVGNTTNATGVELTGDVIFDAVTVSDIDLYGISGGSLTLTGTMKGGSLRGDQSFTVTGTLDNVKLRGELDNGSGLFKFHGIAKDTTFLNYDSFNLSDIKSEGRTEIHADTVSGNYYSSKSSANSNQINAGETLVLKSTDGTGNGTWNVANTLYLAGNIYGDLNGNGQNLYLENDASILEGGLKNIKIRILKDFSWNGNIKITSGSSGVRLFLGENHTDAKLITFNMTADVENVSEVIADNVTVEGHGKTIITPKLTVGEKAYFNDVTIKSGNDLSVSTEETHNFKNSTLHAGNRLDIEGDLINLTGNSTLTAQKIQAKNISVNGTLGVNGELFVDGFTGTGGNSLLVFGDDAKLNTRYSAYSDRIVRFSDINIQAGKTLEQTEEGIHYSINGSMALTSETEIKMNRLSNLYVNGSFDFSKGSLSIGKNNIELGENAVMKGNAVVSAETENVSTVVLNKNAKWIGSLSSVNNNDNVTLEINADDFTLDNDLKIAKNTLHALNIQKNLTLAGGAVVDMNAVTARMPGIDVSIDGNGTLRANMFIDANSYSFKDIAIEAREKNLDIGTIADFTNNAISAPGAITFHNAATFHGASFLSAQSIKAKAVALDGTLTVSGVLHADKITGGTLNIVLPETAVTSPIVTADAENVTLTLDLKNVKGKEAQKYRLTNTKDGYTVSGDYGKYAFSADGDFADYRADKDAFSFANAWKNSDGTLWVMRISGGAQAAIDDLRAAGIFVSPVEENASKILEMANNNPFADALTALLDSGNPALQKQALREVVPTDAAASAFKSAKNTANAVMNAVSGRLGGSSSVSGRSGGDLTVGESSVWVQGMLNHAKMTGGFKADTAGFAAGVETNLTDEIKAGFGYAYASTDIKTDRSKTDANTHTGFVYGEYAPDALYVNAMLSFGRSDYDDKAKLSGMKNSYKADTYSARVATGYALGVLTPEAALRFTAVRQKAYTDALGARVSAKSLNTATMVAGAKAAKTFTADKYAVTPEAKLALTYDLARPNEDRTVTLPDGSSYVAAGEKLNRLGLEIGAKAAVRLTNAVEVSLSYDGAFKEHYQDHTGLMNVKVEF